MNRVLIVCHNFESAKRQVDDMVHLYGNAIIRASLNELTIELESTTYQFMSLSQVSPDRMMGRTYQTVIIDEMVELTTEQRAMIMSRKRNND